MTAAKPVSEAVIVAVSSLPMAKIPDVGLKVTDVMVANIASIAGVFAARGAVV